MKRKDREEFAEKRLNQKRYIIEFQKQIDINKIYLDHYLSDHIEIIAYNAKVQKGNFFISKDASINEVISCLSAILNISVDDISIYEKGDGLSNLYPL
ncbi:hypothetical protein ACS127_11905 [Amphibacillus sp. Q70]|uniref:hypothetical protein n=1 Tax=Amphibacillus sp. Q70 TaxID=3453416 RepID=UPI003F8608B7